MNTKQYYIIECGVNEIDFALELLEAVKKEGHYYVLNITMHMEAVSFQRVTREAFHKFNKYA
jgi:hypothetical protein